SERRAKNRAFRRFYQALRALVIGREDHHHLPAFHHWLPLDRAQIRKGFCQGGELCLRQILVDDLPTPKADRDLDLMSLLQKSARALGLDLKVVRVDLGTQAQLLELDALLFLAGIALSFALLVFELPVIHDPADRGLGVRGDLDEIEIVAGCDVQSFLGGENAELIALRIDHPDAPAPDLMIDPRTFFTRGRQRWISTNH